MKNHDFHENQMSVTLQPLIRLGSPDMMYFSKVSGDQRNNIFFVTPVGGEFGGMWPDLPLSTQPAQGAPSE